MIELGTWLCVILDAGIFWFVYREWAESRELNRKLSKVYRAKKHKVDANRIVKEIVKQEVK